LLIGLNTNAEDMAELVRREAALGLFRDGRISSGMASRGTKDNQPHCFDWSADILVKSCRG
jgi:hypothetical protein